MGAPIPLRIIEAPVEGVGYDGIEVGDMWRWPRGDRDGRESWAILLPGRTTWWTTDYARGSSGASGGRWDVAGAAPLITVSPSIFVNPPHGWHGFIRDGQLMDA